MPTRSHRVGGRDQLAPAPAAVGPRDGRRSRARASGAPRFAGGRRHLNDHPDIVIQHDAPQPVSLYRANRGLGKLTAGLRWFAGLEGLASSNHFEAGGFIRSRPGIEHPDLQLTFMPLAIKPGTVEDVGMHSFQVHIDLMRPRSLGRVSIRSSDPEAAPSIRFNYLVDPQDRADLRAAVRLTREILGQPALARYRGEEINPGAAVQTDEEIDEWVRRNVETCYHPVGTCRMGSDPEESVVDEECRVHGLDCLRVVDASVMPAIVSGNTNAPTIMIAEKLSDSSAAAPLCRSSPLLYGCIPTGPPRSAEVPNNRSNPPDRAPGPSCRAHRPRGRIPLVRASRHARIGCQSFERRRLARGTNF